LQSRPSNISAAGATSSSRGGTNIKEDLLSDTILARRENSPFQHVLEGLKVYKSCHTTGVFLRGVSSNTLPAFRRRDFANTTAGTPQASRGINFRGGGTVYSLPSRASRNHTPIIHRRTTERCSPNQRQRGGNILHKRRFRAATPNIHSGRRAKHPRATKNGNLTTRESHPGRTTPLQKGAWQTLPRPQTETERRNIGTGPAIKEQSQLRANQLPQNSAGRRGLNSTTGRHKQVSPLRGPPNSRVPRNNPHDLTSDKGDFTGPERRPHDNISQKHPTP